MENFGDSIHSNDTWMTSSALVLTTPLSAEQRALQEQRRQLLRDYRNLRLRIATAQYELPHDILQDLTAMKERLESCALDAPETFNELLDDLSGFLKDIGVTLDTRDARALEVPGPKRARPSTSPAYPGGASSDRSPSEMLDTRDAQALVSGS